MSREVVLYIATSLDGYIANIESNVDWAPPGAKGYGFTEFFSNVSTVLMGRKTYDQISSRNTMFPYQGKECYVFSRTKDGQDDNVTFVNTQIEEFVSRLKRKDGKNIWLVGGGSMIEAFIKQNLIDRYRIYIVPHLLGDGIPLFVPQDNEVPLKLVKSVDYPNGVIELQYVRKS
ncbi:MAG: dihydrofolate reductase family protein [Candidatus Heimdallarchaeota archaeon]